MSVVDWLLDSDPSIRWQVLRDLAREPDAVVAAERARVATEGWGAQLLDLQAPDGHWGGGPWVKHSWASSMETLMLLRAFGLDPAGERTRRAIARVRGTDWGAEWGHSPFFEGEVEPCINGRVLACGAWFGEPSDRLVERLLGQQLADGGWNCYAPPGTRSSFHSTLCVLEGLLEYERHKGPTAAVTIARLRGQDYLLERSLFRKRSTGDVIKPEWLQLAFPNRWHYDILWGLDHLRRAGADPDPRAAEAVELVEKKRSSDGRWPLESSHAGKVHFEMEEGVGQPSRWLTLNALRVLDWYRP